MTHPRLAGRLATGEKPDRVSRLVRDAHDTRHSPTGSHVDGQPQPEPQIHVLQVAKEILSSGELGEIYEVHCRSMSGGGADPDGPLTWRHREELSGVNTMALGIFSETMNRWFGDTTSVQAQMTTHINKRKDPETGEMVEITIPDSIHILATMTSP